MLLENADPGGTAEQSLFVRPPEISAKGPPPGGPLMFLLETLCISNHTAASCFIFFKGKTLGKIICEFLVVFFTGGRLPQGKTVESSQCHILLNKARWGKGWGLGEGEHPLAQAEGVPPPPEKTNLKKFLTSSACSDKQAGVLHGRTSLDGREGQVDLSCAPKAPLWRLRDLTCAGVTRCRDIVEPFQPVDGSRPLCERPGAVRCRGGKPRFGDPAFLQAAAFCGGCPEAPGASRE